VCGDGLMIKADFSESGIMRQGTGKTENFISTEKDQKV
jgi:hypothetical protein